jgi:hypothetical protein
MLSLRGRISSCFTRQPPEYFVAIRVSYVVQRLHIRFRTIYKHDVEKTGCCISCLESLRRTCDTGDLYSYLMRTTRNIYRIAFALFWHMCSCLPQCCANTCSPGCNAILTSFPRARVRARYLILTLLTCSYSSGFLTALECQKYIPR